MTISLRRLSEGLWVILRCWISERRFRQHHRAHVFHLRKAADHADAMAAELGHRANLCARYGGRPGPSAPRSGSGIPLVPQPSHQVTDSPASTFAAVPSCDGAALSPEGRRSAGITTRGGGHLT